MTTLANNLQDPPGVTTNVDISENLDVPYWLQGYQITDTENHPEWIHHRKDEFRKDVGGPFFTQKWTSHCVNTQGDIQGEYIVGYIPGIWPDGTQHFRARYNGPLLPLPPHQLEWPTVYPSSNDDLDEYGSTAIARCSPSNPTTDLTTTIGEIFHEGIPKVVGGTLKTWGKLTNRDRRRAIGQEYLNVEFGWKPFTSALKDALKSMLTADEVWKRYVDNSGRMVRRRYQFPEETSTNIQVVASNASPWHSPSTSIYSKNSSSGGIVYRTDKVTVRRWFSGAFVYYVPPVGDSQEQIARAIIMARKTLGISLTPDSVWNLAPWSWAVDWFSNTGDVLSNWSDWAIDNQVLLYGYIMEHKRHERTYTFTGDTGYQSGSVPMDVVKVCETKVRRQASPYGFGVSDTDLSDRQKTIIAALGISKSK